MANSPKEVLDLLGNIYKKARKKTEIELKEFEEFMS
jgi:Zn-dependent oligopeptidase